MSSENEPNLLPRQDVGACEHGEEVPRAQKRRASATDDDNASLAPPPKRAASSQPEQPAKIWIPPFSDEDLLEGVRLANLQAGFGDFRGINFAKLIPSRRRHLEEFVRTVLGPMRNEIVKTSTGVQEVFGGYQVVSSDPKQQEAWHHDAFSNNVARFLKDIHWEHLRHSVSTFVGYCLPGQTSLDDFDEATAARARSMSREADNHVKNNINGWSMRFYAGWVWHILCDNLFSPDCDEKWREGPWEILKLIRATFGSSVTQRENEFTYAYHASRHMVARMLFMFHGEHTDPERLKKIIQQEFASLMKLKGTEQLDADEHIDNLVQAAIAVDRIVVGSKYDIRITMRDPDTKKRHSFLPSKDPKIMKLGLSEDIEPWEKEEDFPVETIYHPLVQVFNKVIGKDISHFKTCVWSIPMEVVRKQFMIRKYPNAAEYRRHNQEQREKWMAEAAAREKGGEGEGEEGQSAVNAV